MSSTRREHAAAIRASLTGKAFQMIDEHNSRRDQALPATKNLNSTAVENRAGVQSRESRIDLTTSIPSASPRIEERRIIGEQARPPLRVQLTSRGRRGIKASEKSRNSDCGSAVQSRSLRIKGRDGKQEDAGGESQRNHENLQTRRSTHLPTKFLECGAHHTRRLRGVVWRQYERNLPTEA